MSQPEPTQAGNVRQLLVFVGGLAVLGVLLVAVLFGNTLFAPEEVAQPTPFVPTFELVTPATAGILGEMGNVEMGEEAPDFTLPTLVGEEISLSGLRGRPVLLNFWATWCAPCRIEMPELESAYKSHTTDELAIIAINREETAALVEPFVTDMGLTFDIALDEKAEVSNLYGVFNMPTSYFLDGSGRVVAIHRGPMSEEQIEEYLQLALEGRE